MVSSSMDKRFVIRRAIDTDNVLLAELNQKTFRETYIDDSDIVYDEKDLKDYFRTSVSPESFAKKIEDPKQAIWIIQNKINGQFAAFANTGPCRLSFKDIDKDKDGQFYRLYILRDYQDYGLGHFLMKVALVWIEEQFPNRPIWLGVWTENLKAQEFHKQYNFKKVGEGFYQIGNYQRPSFIMRRESSSA
jgi:ribosomal protein S18 acetylase RimI-like enzyme